MCITKNRKGRDLVGGEEIKRKWKEYMEELYQKDLNELDNHNGVVSHPEPDILECEVRWALEALLSVKLLDEMEFQQSYSKPKKMMLLKCCTHPNSQDGQY